MTNVGCWLSECKYCEDGWCTRGMITIGEDQECEDFMHFRDEYKHEYWIAVKPYGKDEISRRLIKKGERIEHNGYVFYTEDKIDREGTYRLTEERTGYSVGEYRTIEDRWAKFVEIEATLPDVLTYPEEKRKR